MSPLHALTMCPVWSVPRASGDEPNTMSKINYHEQCSPRERG